MQNSVHSKSGVPQWYIVLNKNKRIIAGLGVIENDFHKRKDLTPNICALFVEKEYRNKGLASKLLEAACEDIAEKGAAAVYLITSHTEFYERCGWGFYGVIEENDGTPTRMYQLKLK